MYFVINITPNIIQFHKQLSPRNEEKYFQLLKLNGSLTKRHQNVSLVLTRTVNKGYYSAVRRYQFYFPVVKTIFYERAQQVS